MPVIGDTRASYRERVFASIITSWLRGITPEVHRSSQPRVCFMHYYAGFYSGFNSDHSLRFCQTVWTAGRTATPASNDDLVMSCAVLLVHFFDLRHFYILSC